MGAARQQASGGGESTLTVKMVFFEDTAALVGLLLAFAGVGLHQLTGSALWDGLASLLIGVLLAGVAYLLGRTNMRLLIGRQADARLVRAIHARLNTKPEVDQVVDLLTMLIKRYGSPLTSTTSAT